MKKVSKGCVAKRDCERHVRNERAILSALRGSSPFVVSLLGTFQDASHLYFVLEFVAGGELFSKLRGNMCLSEHSARFYLCEILAALAHVHDRGYAYRDLKPENVLLDLDGHCRLVDFGFAKQPPGDVSRATGVSFCSTSLDQAYLETTRLKACVCARVFKIKK